jgi:hypothetical protein
VRALSLVFNFVPFCAVQCGYFNTGTVQPEGAEAAKSAV